MSTVYSLSEIATYLGAELRGNADAQITGLNTIQDAVAGQLTFLANPKYGHYLDECKAEAVILDAIRAENFQGSCLVMENPYYGYARLSAWFDPRPKPESEIHPSAVISSSANIAEDVYLGPNVVVEAGTTIGSGSYIAANCYIGERSSIGERCRFAANVTIYHDVVIRDRVTLHSGVVIGGDGFGFAPDGSGNWQKIHQIGGVSIGNDVEIGANTTVDRGALGDTVLGNGVILDNHVQVAHNVVIGDNTAMAAYSGVSGSTVIGKNCILAGNVGVAGHLSICDNVVVTAKTPLTKSIKEPGSYSAGTFPVMTTGEWRKNAVRIGHLNDLAKRIKTLEKNNK